MHRRQTAVRGFRVPWTRLAGDQLPIRGGDQLREALWSEQQDFSGGSFDPVQIRRVVTDDEERAARRDGLAEAVKDLFAPFAG